MVRVTAHAGVSYLCGLIAAALLSALSAYVFAACIVLILISFAFRDYVRLFLIMFSVGALCYSFAYTHGKQQLRYEGTKQTLECTVYEATGSNTPFYVCDSRMPDGSSVKIGLYIKNGGSINAGDRLTVSGKLVRPTRNEMYYRSKSVFLIMFYPHIEDVQVTRGILSSLRHYRSSVISQIQKYTAQDPEQLLAGMLFGSRNSELSAQTKNALYGAGVGHITAVSGLHLSLIAVVFSALFSRRRFLRFFAAAGSAAVVCVLADLSVSSVRALIMIILLYAAPLAHRKCDPLTSLCIAIFVITLPSPLCVTGASFALSAAGVFGAAVLSGYICGNISKKTAEKRELEHYELPPILCMLISVICAAAAVIPVSSLFFDEISLLSPLSNLIIVPIASLAVSLGAVGCLVHIISPAGSYLIFAVCRIICVPVIRLSELFCRMLPPIKAPAPEMIGIAAAAVLLAAVLSRDKKLIVSVIVSVTALTLIFQSVFCLIRPDTIVYEEGCNAAQIVTREGNIFITAEKSHIQPYERSEVIICDRSLFDYYRKISPDSQLIDTEAKTVTAGDSTVVITPERITAEAGGSYLCINR